MQPHSLQKRRCAEIHSRFEGDYLRCKRKTMNELIEYDDKRFLPKVLINEPGSA